MPNLKRIRILWVWAVVVVLVLFLLSSNLGRRRTWNPAEQFIVEIVAPFQKFINETILFVEDFWLRYFYLVNVREENEQLKRDIAALKMEDSRCRELRAANNRLRELLRFKETIHWPVLAVQVIGRDPTGWFRSVIIDKGEDSGLKVNMPVVDANGVVGRLVSVSPHYAKVLLIVDQNSAVDCIVQRSREKGIVKGVTPKLCRLEYVVKTGDVREGDRVVTSGLGRVYPKGLPVGEVIRVNRSQGELFKDIEVQPMVNFAKLEELLVVLKEDPLSRERKADE